MGRSIAERLRTIESWTASYTPALSVARGEVVTSHHTDPDNPGWRWTINAQGLGGWLPEGLVQNGRANAPFDSTELTCATGVEVTRLDRCNGWSFCQTKDGTTGWLPDSCLARA